MDLRYLRYFIAVAEEMNFTRAAERLHTVQPSLSRQIRRLEEIVGTPLFHRDKHEMELTEAGRIFLDESRAILQRVNHAITLARQGARAEAGHIAVGFILGTEARIFSDLLPTLKARCPEMQIGYHAMTESELMAALEEQEINVAFLPGPIESSWVCSEAILRQRIVAVLPAAHPLAKLKRIPLARLAAVPIIGPSRNANPKYVNCVNEIAKRGGVQFTGTIEHDNVLSGLHAVSLGLGFCLIPDYQKEILPGNVVVRSLDLDPQPSFDLLIAYRKDDRTPALPFFLSIARECLQLVDHKD
jgi:LysR family hca operon transcriptional activator